MRVIWSRRARQDVAGIREYLRQRNPIAALAVAESLFAAGNSLSELPRRYAEYPEGYREMVVSRYHYILRYALTTDPENPKTQAVSILSVWHPAQDR